MNLKISVGVWYMGSVYDRFVKDGYRKDVNIVNRIRAISEIEDAGGIEIHYPTEISEDNIGEIKKVLNETSLIVLFIILHLVKNSGGVSYLLQRIHQAVCF